MKLGERRCMNGTHDADSVVDAAEIHVGDARADDSPREATGVGKVISILGRHIDPVSLDRLGSHQSADPEPRTRT